MNTKILFDISNLWQDILNFISIIYVLGFTNKWFQKKVLLHIHNYQFKIFKYSVDITYRFLKRLLVTRLMAILTPTSFLSFDKIILTFKQFIMSIIIQKIPSSCLNEMLDLFSFPSCLNEMLYGFLFFFQKQLT